MQDKTKAGKIFTWILLSIAAFGQLLVVAEFARGSLDTTIAVGYIDLNFNFDTANLISYGVIVFVAAAIVLCTFRGAQLTLGAIAVSMFIFDVFLHVYVPFNARGLWGLCVVVALLGFAYSWLRENYVTAKRQRVPADAGALEATPEAHDDLQ